MRRFNVQITQPVIRNENQIRNSHNSCEKLSRLEESISK